MDAALVAMVKLQRGELTQQIKNLKQKDWLKACERLGLWVAEGGGKGSHVAVYCEVDCNRSNSNNLVLTVQKHLTPNIQTDKLKQLVAYGQHSGAYSEDDVWRALRILK
jgi:hypothetical protein